MAATVNQTLLVGDMQAIALWLAEMPPIRNEKSAAAICETVGTALQRLADEDAEVRAAYNSQLDEEEDSDEGTPEFWDAVLARI